eukprot:6173494-Pleurochrysis_carterae.AAC.7
MLCRSPPPWVGSLSTESDAYSMHVRNAATPSRRAMGPEKSSSALRVGRGQVGASEVGPDCPGSEMGASGGVGPVGSPGGCDASPFEGCAMDCAFVRSSARQVTPGKTELVEVYVGGRYYVSC